MKYSVIFEKCNDGGYVAYVPDLPLCFSVGNTLSEVKANIKEAIELYHEEKHIKRDTVLPIILNLDCETSHRVRLMDFLN
jgi:predicted RNase H-like HicB family nuclease